MLSFRHKKQSSKNVADTTFNLTALIETKQNSNNSKLVNRVSARNNFPAFSGNILAVTFYYIFRIYVTALKKKSCIPKHTLTSVFFWLTTFVCFSVFIFSWFISYIVKMVNQQPISFAAPSNELKQSCNWLTICMGSALVWNRFHKRH